MNNYNYTRPPRKGVIVFVSFVFAAIFGIAFFSTYEQRTDLGHSVHVSPTSANYGTVSTARPQALVVPMQSSAPKLSGSAIRSYAYSGHATMPKASSAGSNFKMYTTSSASVHSLGSGGGGGGGSMGGGSSYSGSSSKGIQYSGGSVSLPSLAFATPMYGSGNQGTAYYGIGRRRVNPHAGDIGSEGDKYADTEDPNKWWYWSEEAEGWITGYPPEGTIKEENGLIYEADGKGGWTLKGQVEDMGTPIGDAPCLWMLLLAIAYVSAKVVRKRIASLSITTLD